MDELTMFIVDLFVLLACAVVAGEIAVHLGQVAMVGQLLAGLIIGPTLLGPYIGLSTLTPELSTIQFLATVFILFMAGIEVTPQRVMNMGPLSFWLGVAIFLIPMTIGTFAITFVLPSIGYPENVLVALTLAMTALPVMGIMLSEFGLLRTKLGDLLLNAAVVNELLAVALFAILLRLGPAAVGDLYSVGLAIVSVGGFLLVMFGLQWLLKYLRDKHMWDPFSERFTAFWKSKQGGFALLMIILFGSTLFSQFLGLTYVLGAFFAGLFVTKETVGRDAYESIRYIFEVMTWGFFVPLFMAFAGIQMNLRLLTTTGLAVALIILLIVAFFSKYATGAAIALWAGWKRSDANAVGYMVGSRGVVALALASILLQDNRIAPDIFTIIASVGVITTIIAPIGALTGWLSDTESRKDLLKRAPSLDVHQPSVSQLRMPVQWTGTVFASDRTGSFKLREWLMDRTQEEGPRGAASLNGVRSGRGGAVAKAPPKNECEPSPTTPAKKPPIT
jgi:Kef-type K+ transport system membrane component KefB